MRYIYGIVRSNEQKVFDIEPLPGGDGVAGERFTLAPGAALAYERARPSVPLLIGTWGERTAA